MRVGLVSIIKSEAANIEVIIDFTRYFALSSEKINLIPDFGLEFVVKFIRS
jgi:hypothetical protein